MCVHQSPVYAHANTKSHVCRSTSLEHVHDCIIILYTAIVYMESVAAFCPFHLKRILSKEYRFLDRVP